MDIFKILIIIGVGLLIKSYLPKYIEEKAKNLATKEDIEEIASKVENRIALAFPDSTTLVFLG